MVKRCKIYFFNFFCGVMVIVGNNGYVWIFFLENEDVIFVDGLVNSLENDINVLR